MAEEKAEQLRKVGAEAHLRGSYGAAVDSYEEALALVPRHSATLLNQADACFEVGMFRKCVRCCDAVLQQDGNSLPAFLLKARALKAMKKTKIAQRVLKEGMALFGEIRYMEALRAEAEGKLTATKRTPELTESAKGNEKNSGLRLSPGNSSQRVTTVGEEALADKSTMVAEKGLVQNGVGKVEVDERIARGYLQVNTGKLAEAVSTFNALIRELTPPPIGALLGRGTAFAIAGNLTQAISDFSSAIEVDKNCFEAWKRRGQARAANGSLDSAVTDLTESLRIKRDADGLHQRGLVYHKQKNYKRALKDFQDAIALDESNSTNWNHAGICLTTIGQAAQALHCLKKAVQLNPRYKEAFLNIGQAHKELGCFEEANTFYSKALTIDENYFQAYHLRGVAKHSSGRHYEALADFKKASELNPEFVESQHMVGVMQHGLGLLQQADASYTKCLAMQPKDHVSVVLAFYNRAVCRFLSSHLDVPWSTFNFDYEMDPYFKEAWCKRTLPSQVGKTLPEFPVASVSLEYSSTPADEGLAKLLEAAKKIGPKIQLDCAGYMPNERQWRMCGYAALEVAQQLKKAIEGEYIVPGTWSSSKREEHAFYWRDLYDIIVRWRQFSEPNDPVVWVDLLSPEQFAEGFGSHTPMITHQTHVVRYSPMFERSFKIMKGLISQTGVSYNDKSLVEKAKTCKDAYAVLRRDFWVCTPCHSLKTPGKVMEGTRLTLQYVHPEGFEYSIRTPGTPPRFVEYEEEMDFIWAQFMTEAKKPKDERDLDRLSDLILTLTFFWYNFMPLARGTAACGYVGLLGMFLALDIDIDTPVPKGFQVDWEGILTPNCEDFIAALKGWMYPARKETSMLHGLPDVACKIDTLRKLIAALNCK